ncbi:MAG: class II aldolase/adducin family protein [Spirochaetaceae bacterium]|jgi:rhamnose utilization protein RhaD (predicted bifunctional aldolase and dehydrogenase)|nr:class II aldolase/adducin family protein [Spirochaetaceae bacterium]
MIDIEKLTGISRRYGANPEYVIAGGGNTSCKDDSTLAVKSSGTSLGEISFEGFVKLDRRRLREIREKTYPAEPDEREAQVLADMLAARLPGEEHKRPSVETLLHDILPFPWVVHTHPALVNGLTCSRDAEAGAAKLFPESIWIPSINPGYILSQKVAQALEEYQAKHGKTGQVIFLQNHGVFVSANTTKDVDDSYQRILETLRSCILRNPDFSEEVFVWENSEEIRQRIVAFAGGAKRAVFLRNQEIARITQNRAAFEPVSSAFTPDHIVYAGSNPIFIESFSDIQEQWNLQASRIGKTPKIIAVQNMGVFGIGDSEKAAHLALELFTDAMKIAAYTESFGGSRFMPQDQIDFINNWEVERYRSKVSAE